MALENEISLGEFLRLERERRCITIEQVASATKVGIRTLHLLEEDHYAELPAKPFIRGFVNSYCRFIGLDSKEVLARFDDYISKKTHERPNRESGHSGYVFEKKDGEQQGRTILLMAIFGFIFVGGLAMLLLKPSLHHHRRSHIDKLRAVHPVGENQGPILSAIPSGVPSGSAAHVISVSTGPRQEIGPVMSGAPVANMSPVPSPSGVMGDEKGSPHAQSTPGVDPNDPLDSGVGLKPDEIRHKMVSKVLADIWVRYQVDDRPLRKFIVRKGRSLVLRGKDKIWIQVSNPNSLTFNYNNHGAEWANHLKNTTLVRGITTVYYPNELAEKIEKILAHEKPLPVTPDPSVDQDTPLSVPKP